MLEHLNIQSIAKWFERGCDSQVTDASKGDHEKGFHILECNDICLLSKLADVKNQTLRERAHKQLQQIKEPLSRKNFLLTICNEFIRDGRKSLSLNMLSEEIENHNELYNGFRSDLLFHRAFCYLKHDQTKEALSDLYQALSNSRIKSLDKIHVQILEEIKKCLSSSKLMEGFISTEHHEEITFEKVLKQYETEICQFIEQQMNKEKLDSGKGEHASGEEFQDETPSDSGTAAIASKSDEKSDFLQCIIESKRQYSLRSEATYKSKLVGSQDTNAQNYLSSQTACYHARISRKQDAQKQNANTMSQAPLKAYANNEIELTYWVNNQKKISVWRALNGQIIDNIFNLRAILVSKLRTEVRLNTVCEIFERFGKIVNIMYKEDADNKLIVEYDNSDSPRFAISYLSEAPLPFVSEHNQRLEFRFYKSESQRTMRICKSLQSKTSRECYFWRTTGCQNGDNCKFYHNKLAEGVDYQEWMKIEQFQNGYNGRRFFNNNNNTHFVSSTIGRKPFNFK